jgi:hypothetical protein
MNNIIKEMRTLINNNVINGQPNQVKMWSYKNFAVTTIILVHKAFASTHLVA